jgi:hypothetical protein
LAKLKLIAGGAPANFTSKRGERVFAVTVGLVLEDGFGSQAEGMGGNFSNRNLAIGLPAEANKEAKGEQLHFRVILAASPGNGPTKE